MIEMKPSKWLSSSKSRPVQEILGFSKAINSLLVVVLLSRASLIHAMTSEPLSLLEKMATAGQTLNYEGTVVYQRGGNTATMQVVHSFDQYGERERLSSLANNPREMVRDGQNVFFIVPAKRFVLIESRGTDDGGVDLSIPAGTQYYEIDLRGTEHVAGYSCQVLKVFPKDEYRYGYHLCIEGKTGILLKSQTLDAKGGLREQVIYKALHLLDSIPTKRLQTTLREEGFTLWKPEATQEVNDSLSPNMGLSWRFDKLPPGFLVIRNEMRQIASSKQPVRYITLHDGIASVSVFIERLKRDASTPLQGLSQSGALSTFSKVMDDFIVTVIGEVPVITVEMIADSLRYQDANLH